MNRETFLSILKEENVEFCVTENQEVIVRKKYVLLRSNCGDENAYITPDDDYVRAGIFETTLDCTPLPKVTREDVMKLVNAYHNTNM